MLAICFSLCYDAGVNQRKLNLEERRAGMQPKLRGAEYRTTYVCVDSYRSQVLQGRFFHPAIDGGYTFESLTQFLKGMEQVLEITDCPTAFTTQRSFAPPAFHSTGPPAVDYQKGELATFAVRILFRQNASWQGSVVWLEGKQEQSFRSVLELIGLFNSALMQRIPA